MRRESQTIEELIQVARTWPGVKVSYREEWDCEYFEVAGKYFCLLGENKAGELIMTVKNLPETNELLREQYSFIVPGYYTNKTHWNSIMLEETSFSMKELSGYLRQSYELIVAKLPKKIASQLE